ncbi:DNA-packaging protein [uncultured Sphingomonas sp.]|uniref:DNA-packaging protein n=1 Tax=uncultured Sphingomonas sp. TaxID=158754 RepID=UPI0035CA22C6
MSPLLAALAGLSPEKQAVVIRSLPDASLRRWAWDFGEWAHDGQSAPAGDWRTWVIMGGRGFGKTRAGAEWVLAQVRAAPDPKRLRVALVGATIDDARAVMIDGPSGLLTLAKPGEIARWRAADRTLEWTNGAEAALFSGRSPQRLRGPEHDLAWCDELGKWRYAQATWDMLQLGLRRGARPRAIVTTTPSPEPALARLLAAADTVRTGGTSRANRHLPAAFLAAIDAAYGGTRLGRQEIEGELLGDREGSLWPAWLIERCRRATPPAEHGFVRIVVGVDPPATAAGTCGIVVAGLARDGGTGAERAWVLDDRSAVRPSPEGWARAVAQAAHDWGADRVVAEANQGGDMVREVLRHAPGGMGARLPIELVHASRAKVTRAEPVAALFERGEAGFAGAFPALEAELGGFVAGGYVGEASPDRADAMVWALWALMLKGRWMPRVVPLATRS